MVKLHKDQLYPSKGAWILHGLGNSGTAICYCNTEIETSNHFLLRCQLNVIVRRKLHSTPHCIRPKTFNMADDDLVMLMLYGSNNHDGNIKRVLEATVRYIDESFNKPLLWPWNYNTNRNNVRKSLVICATQLAGGLLWKKLKVFWSYANYFAILAGVRKCRILIGLCKINFFELPNHISCF